MTQFTHRELYLAIALAALTALVLYAVYRWRASQRRYEQDKAELTRTQAFLTSLHDPTLTLRRVHPHGTLVLDQQPWKDVRLILRPAGEDAYPDAPWARSIVCAVQCWREDVTAEISGWHKELTR